MNAVSDSTSSPSSSERSMVVSPSVGNLLCLPGPEGGNNWEGQMREVSHRCLSRCRPLAPAEVVRRPVGPVYPPPLGVRQHAMPLARAAPVQVSEA
jgi:hypothetical protein